MEILIYIGGVFAVALIGVIGWRKYPDQYQYIALVALMWPCLILLPFMMLSEWLEGTKERRLLHDKGVNPKALKFGDKIRIGWLLSDGKTTHDFLANFVSYDGERFVTFTYADDDNRENSVPSHNVRELLA